MKLLQPYTEQRALPLLTVASSLAQRLRADSLMRNSLYIMCTTVVTSLLGYVYWIVAARTYSHHDVGLASALIGAMTLVSNLASFGMGPALIQTLPQRASGRPWSTTLNAGLAVTILAGLVAGALISVVLPLLSPQFAVVHQSSAYTLAFTAGVPLWTVSLLLDYVFVAERAAGKMLGRNTIFAVLKIPLLGLPLAATHIGALGIVVSWVVATLVAAAGAVLWFIPRLGRGYVLAVRGIVGQVRSMARSLVGHHIINIGGQAPMYLLPTFVVMRLSAADNSYFYITWMLGSLFFIVSPAVAASLFAEGSHASGDVLRKARTSMLIIGALLVPAMAVFWLGGAYIMAVFGPSYPRHGTLLLALLIISAVPDAITNVYVSVLRVQRRLRYASLLNVGMAALTLALAWVLLPLDGIAGAGWAWLIAQIAGSIFIAVDVLVAWWRRGQGLVAAGVTPLATDGPAGKR